MLAKKLQKLSRTYLNKQANSFSRKNLKPELERKDFLILSALEKVKYSKIYTEIYGIVAGETIATGTISRVRQNFKP